MKIVYCIAGTYNSGGMERVLANKANYWALRGHEVTIVTTDQRGRESFFALEEGVNCVDLEVNYEENNGRSFWHKLLHYPFKQWKHRVRLAALLKKLKPDITVSMFCHEVSFITCINDGSKKVLEVHFSRFKRLQYERKGLWRMADVWRSRADEKAVKKFDRFVVLTREDRKYWGNLPRMEVIPNAVAAIPLQPSKLLNKRAVAVGRYTHQKGFDYLIDAWVFVHWMQPEWELDIVGDGECREALQKQIDDYGLQQMVHLVPPTDLMGQVYSRASILVMSSRYEGLPMVLLEGASFGLPLVAFACQCGPADIIADEVNGFLITQGSVKQLSEKLTILMKDEALRKQMGQAARETAKRFTEEKVMQKWTALFEQLLTQKA